MEDFKNLFTIEFTIYDFYQRLSDCEMLGIDINSSEYNYIINTIKYLVQDEEKLITSLSINDAGEIAEYARKNIKNIPKDKIKSATERAINRYNEYLLRKDKEKTTDYKLSQIVSIEYNDIFFSFFDEVIEAISNIKGSIREKIIKEKYSIIFNCNKEEESKLLDRKCHTDYSLYLTSELSAGVIGVSKDELDEFKMQCSFKELAYINKKFKETKDLSLIDSIVLATRRRTAMLLFDDIVFKSLRTVKNAEEYDEFYVKDRVRHKKISLKIENE